MAEIDREFLFGKLNKLGFDAAEAAWLFCRLRRHDFVELVHWFHQVFQLQDSDLHQIARHFGINPSTLGADLTAALDRVRRGVGSEPGFSTHFLESIKEGWMYGSLMFHDNSQVRTGYVLIGILKSPSMRGVLLGISSEFGKIKIDALTDDFARIAGSSSEGTLTATDGSGAAAGQTAAPGEPGLPGPGAPAGKQEALRKFCVDWTEKARKGEMDPVVGRDEEIRQIIDILLRRRQNNPILTGEAGVGKTAVVEGFAIRVAQGDVPPPLKDVSVLSLDVGLLSAGASMKGEFEQRLRGVIDEVQASPRPIVLFIDEAHTLVGAGGQAGTGDAANLLKPALARGRLRTIAATTWAEYKRHIEKDPALTRRFQVIKVDEPSEAKAVLMLRGMIAVQEKHHQVQVLDEAIDAAVRLSHRYIPARQLPDKAVSLLDTACARVAVSQHGTPAAVEDTRRRIEALEVEAQILAREAAIGVDTGARQAEVAQLLKVQRESLTALEAGWKTEKELVGRILDLRAKLRGAGEAVDAAATTTPAPGAAGPAAAPAPLSPEKTPPLSPAEREAALQTLRDLQKELATLQGENPLILPSVDSQAIASVVADWTGIPVGRMVKNEIDSVLRLADTLEGRVIGQRHALETIARRVQTSRARLDNPGRPIGVFMLAGPSGVGKTETALALAESLYGGEHNLITINMSEFQESHTVSTLKGSPPGYVGYGEGGILTEAVRRRPYSVVLLDEVEKAHKDVHEIFFQVFDKGHMEDSEGRDIDFRNTIIILTTNAAQNLVVNMCKDPDLAPSPEGIEKALRPALIQVFPDALINRLVVVPYYPISKEMLQRIIRMQLSRVEKRVRENHRVPCEFDPSVPELIAQRCTELERGARMVDAMITNAMLPDIGREILGRMVRGAPLARVQVSAKDGQFVYSFD